MLEPQYGPRHNLVAFGVAITRYATLTQKIIIYNCFFYEIIFSHHENMEAEWGHFLTGAILSWRPTICRGNTKTLGRCPHGSASCEASVRADVRAGGTVFQLFRFGCVPMLTRTARRDTVAARNGKQPTD
jgi:hypothetical protein